MAEWTVPARVVNVHDGDTVDVDLDLGWRIAKLREPVRIAHINAPELATDAGKVARDYAATLLPVGATVTLVSRKLLGESDKYGRTLGSITMMDGTDFATAMLTAGYAVPYEGGPR